MFLFGPPNVERLKAKKNVKGLIKALRYQKHASVRIQAAHALGQLGDAQAVNSLIAALQDWDVQRAAVQALVVLGSAAVEPLITALQKKYTSPLSLSTVELAAEALGKIGDSRAVEPLITVLPNMGEQKAIVQALVALGSAALGPLIAALRDQYGSVGFGTVQVLAQIREPRVVKPLITALGDREEYVRKAAAEGFETMSADWIADALPDMVASLLEGPWYRQKVIARTLMKLGWQPQDITQRAVLVVAENDWERAVSLGSTAVMPLTAAFYDEDSTVREAAVQALGRMEDIPVASLMVALSAADVQVKQAARDQLQKSECVSSGSIALDVLTTLASTWGRGGWLLSRGSDFMLSVEADWAKERVAIVKALSKAGGGAVEPLVIALTDTYAIRVAAEQALKQIDPNWATLEAARRSVPALVAILHDQKLDKELREAAARTLGQIKDTRTVEPLMRLLHQDMSVQREVAEALSQMRDARIIEPLLTALQDPESDLWSVAARILGKMGETRAVELLIAGLKYDHNRCLNAEEALGNIGDTRAVEPLIATLQSSDSFFGRVAAAKALEKIKDARAIEPLVVVLENDPVRDVREIAASALQSLKWQPPDEKHRAMLAVARKNWQEAASLGSVALEPLLKEIETPNEIERLQIIRALGQIRDARAVRALLSTAGDPAVAETVIHALQTLLESTTREVATEDLRKIAHLEGIVRWGVGGYTDRCGNTTHYTSAVDCSYVRQLARQELIRRGLEA